jgi:hypothetical protein
MTLSIYEQYYNLKRNIDAIEEYLRWYADRGELLYTLDEIVDDINHKYERKVKKANIIEVMDNIDVNLTVKQILWKGVRGYYVVHKEKYRRN